MRRILFLENVLKKVLETPDQESCIFGITGFSFPFKEEGIKVKGPYDLYFYSIGGIPDNLDKKFSIIPYIPKTRKDPEVRRRVTELRRDSPSLKTFALKTENDQDINEAYPIRLVKFKDSRPVADFPQSPYEVYKVKLEDLEKQTSNSHILIDHIAEKIKIIEER